MHNPSDFPSHNSCRKIDKALAYTNVLYDCRYICSYLSDKLLIHYICTNIQYDDPYIVIQAPKHLSLRISKYHA